MVPIISEEKLLSLLPHGSGIDYDWRISIAKNGNIQCRNAFHAMNEHGYYDGVMPFVVFIYREKHDQFNPLFGSCAGKTQVICRKNDISFSIRCDDSRRNSFYGLKDNLYDTLHYSLSPILTHRNETIPTPEKE